MRLRKHMIAALAVTAFAVPVTAVGIFSFSPTPAFAKSGNGNGNGKSQGSENRASGRKDTKPAKSNRGNGNGNSLKKAVAPAAILTETVEPVTLRPDQLGSMNGAMHASINAVLAHIRNGNTNGPVGALAGLAVADHAAEGAQAVIDQAALYGGLESDLETALSNNPDYGSLDEYLAAREEEGFVPDPDVEAALAALDAAGDPPSDEDLANAEAALEAQMAAEAGIFGAWNKSGEATDEERAALLESLRARLDAESEAISDTIGEVDTLGAADEPTGDGMLIEDPMDEKIVADAPRDEESLVE